MDMVSMNKHFCSLPLLCAVLLASCTSEVDTEISIADEYAVSFVSSLPTKIGYCDDGTAIRLSWEKGDGIGIWSEGQSNYHYTAEKDGNPTTFIYASRHEHLRWLTSLESQSFYAAYPYDENASVSYDEVPIDLPAYQRQAYVGSTAHLKGVDFLWAGVQGLHREDGAVPLQFHHLFSVLNVDLVCDRKVKLDSLVLVCSSNPRAALSFTGGKVDLSSGKLDLNGAVKNSREVLQCGFTIQKGSAAQFYMVVNPFLGGETLELRAYAKGSYRVIANKAVPEGGFPQGKDIVLHCDLTVPEEMAVEIRDLSSLGTANTYLVTSPGTSYKFSSRVCGNGIIPQSLADVLPSVDIKASSVLLLWYNCLQSDNSWKDECPIVLSSLELDDDGYVYFDTPGEFVPGHAVIAVFAEKGLGYDDIVVDDKRNITGATLLWSWDIWAAQGYDPEASPLVAGEYRIMSRNLGAIIDGADSEGDYECAAAVGNIYQWGRKDPFPGFDSYSNIYPCRYANKLLSTPTYTPITALQLNSQGASSELDSQMFGYIGSSSSMVERSDFASSDDGIGPYLDYVTAQPHQFVSSAIPEGFSYKTWCYLGDDKFKALWGDPDKGNSRTVVKSLYDPCPVGWRVLWHEVVDALGAVQNGMSDIDANIASNGHGILWDGVYIPLSGDGRSSEDMSFNLAPYGVYNGVARTNAAHWWNASGQDLYPYESYKNQPGRVLFTVPRDYAPSSGAQIGKNWANVNMSQGEPVRCVKE